MDSLKDDENTFKEPFPIENYIFRQPPGCADDTDSDDDEINSIINSKKDFDALERGRRSRSSSVCSVSSVIDDYIPEQWILKDFYLPDNITMKRLGEVLNIIETVVTIGNTEKCNQIVNLESKVFNEDRLCIGVIYDVMGSISDPIYCLRFDTASRAHSVRTGQTLYIAESAKEFTETIFKEAFESMKVESECSDDDEF
uniref:H/ACA ribonucleoprotein complex subunit n=1 Tax=Strongyloides venezuelensis TaxID=75913 RepID=A0A0K0F7E6_STRVS